MKTVRRSVATLFAGALAAALCLGQARTGRKSYTFYGKVIAVNKDTQRLTVDGERVEGWMAAMTMKYQVDDPSLFTRLKPGDEIAATVFDGDHVLHYVRLAPTSVNGTAPGRAANKQEALGQCKTGGAGEVNCSTAVAGNYGQVRYGLGAPPSTPAAAQAPGRPGGDGLPAMPVPGWDERWPDPNKVLAGCSPQEIREFRQQNALLLKNSNDEGALVNRAVAAHRLAKTSKLDMYLDWLAAKDLEQAIKLDPNDFTAWHNYGDLNYDQGDMWAINDHSNRNRALWAFNHAIALNPNSARTYLGRGWTYYELNDLAHANMDFQRALQLDPSLRADMQTEIANIQERHRQEDAARGTISQMSRYYVLKSARNDSECAEGKGTWVITTSKDGHITGGECHVSMALYPGPTQSWEGK